jgi:hypothetical protein
MAFRNDLLAWLRRWLAGKSGPDAECVERTELVDSPCDVEKTACVNVLVYAPSTGTAAAVLTDPLPRPAPPAGGSRRGRVRGPGRVEERRAVRYPCELEANCGPSRSGGLGLRWPARIRNFSRGGLRLLLPARFEPGTVLAIEVQSNDDVPPVRFLAEVVHVAPLSYGGWSLGCAFTHELTDAEVRALMKGSR